MAVILIKFDTNKKSLDVSMDGEKLDDVDNVNIYCVKPIYGPYQESSDDDKDDDEYHIHLCMRKKDEEHDLVHVEHLEASEAHKAILRGEAQFIEELPNYVMYKTISPEKAGLRSKINNYIEAY